VKTVEGDGVKKGESCVYRKKHLVRSRRGKGAKQARAEELHTRAKAGGAGFGGGKKSDDREGG